MFFEYLINVFDAHGEPIAIVSLACDELSRKFSMKRTMNHPMIKAILKGIPEASFEVRTSDFTTPKSVARIGPKFVEKAKRKPQLARVR